MRDLIRGGAEPETIIVRNDCRQLKTILQDKSVIELCRILRDSCSETKISLDSSNTMDWNAIREDITIEDARDLASALAMNYALSSLNLCTCSAYIMCAIANFMFDAEGAKLLGAALCKNSVLTKLCISRVRPL